MTPPSGVDDLLRARGEAQPLQTHRRAHHVPHQRLEIPPVPRMRKDPVVHGEAATPPRQEKIDPLVAHQPTAAQQRQHPCGGIAPRLLARPRTAPGRDTRSPLPARNRGERHRHHAQAEPPPTQAESVPRTGPGGSEGGLSRPSRTLRRGHEGDPPRPGVRRPVPRHPGQPRLLLRRAPGGGRRRAQEDPWRWTPSSPWPTSSWARRTRRCPAPRRRRPDRHRQRQPPPPGVSRVPGGTRHGFSRGGAGGPGPSDPGRLKQRREERYVSAALLAEIHAALGEKEEARLPPPPLRAPLRRSRPEGGRGDRAHSRLTAGRPSPRR